MTARKSPGLVGAVVDNSPIELTALERGDPRRSPVKVAGFGALLVAKLHKLGDRLATPARLQAKDSGDVYRLFDAIAADEMAATLDALLADNRSTATTTKAPTYLDALFTTPAGPGVRLANEALQGLLPEETVTVVMTAYTAALRRMVTPT